MQKTEITSYEAACKVNKEDPNNLPDVSMLPEHEADDVITTLKVKRIIRAYNTDQKTGKVWEPNWNNPREYKYNLWVEPETSKKQPGGFAFSHSIYDLWRSDTHVGSHLCLKNSEDALHMAKHHNDLLVKYYLIIKK